MCPQVFRAERTVQNLVIRDCLQRVRPAFRHPAKDDLATKAGQVGRHQAALVFHNIADGRIIMAGADDHDPGFILVLRNLRATQFVKQRFEIGPVLLFWHRAARQYDRDRLTAADRRMLSLSQRVKLLLQVSYLIAEPDCLPELLIR